MTKIDIKPFSINESWKGQKYKTLAYRAWRKECGWQLKAASQKIDPIKGYVEIHYEFYLRNFRKCDCDNFIKTTTDVLVDMGIIEDDRFVKKFIVEKFPINIDDKTGIALEIFPWMNSLEKEYGK